MPGTKEEVEDQEDTNEDSVLTAEEQKAIEEQGPPEDYGKAPLEVVEDEEESEEDDKTKEGEEKQDESEKGKSDEESKKEGKEDDEENTDEDEKSKDPFVKVETELAKPEGQEKLEKFTDREKAYFYQMRRDRKNRQKAEEERDAALHREIQRKAQDETKKVEKEKEDPEVLKDRDDTDFLTVGEVKELLKSEKKNPVVEDNQSTEAESNPVMTAFLTMADKESRAAHPDDYDAVMELIPELFNSNDKYVQAVRSSVAKGENPAEKTYELIKADPDFAKLFPAAQIKWEAQVNAKKSEETKKDDKAENDEKSKEDKKKEDAAKKAQEALEKNKQKTKTTGNLGGEGNNESSELSMQQIADMSDLEFAKLPKRDRDHYLKKYG